MIHPETTTCHESFECAITSRWLDPQEQSHRQRQRRDGHRQGLRHPHRASAAGPRGRGNHPDLPARSVNLTRQSAKDTPPYDSAVVVDHQDESGIWTHHVRAGYWMDEPHCVRIASARWTCTAPSRSVIVQVRPDSAGVNHASLRS